RPEPSEFRRCRGILSHGRAARGPGADEPYLSRPGVASPGKRLIGDDPGGEDRSGLGVASAKGGFVTGAFGGCLASAGPGSGRFWIGSYDRELGWSVRLP